MANKTKGRVSFEQDGQTFNLRLGINEIVELEDELDKSINEIAAMLGNPEKLRMGVVRSIFRAALKGGGHDMAADQVGELLGSMHMDQTMERLGETFNASFPEAEGESGPPAKRQDGTGKDS